MKAEETNIKIYCLDVILRSQFYLMVVVDGLRGLRGLRGERECVLNLVNNTHRALGGATLLYPAFSVSAGFNGFRFLYENESVLTLCV